MAGQIIEFLDMQLLQAMADGHNLNEGTELVFAFRSAEINPIQLRMDDEKEYSFANADIAVGFMLGLRDATGGNNGK